MLSSADAQQNTYGEIAMDAGGWVSGFAQHSSGRLYGYGDIFGIYRSDDFGANWTFLQNKMTDTSTTVSGVAVSPTSADRVAFTAGNGVWTSTNAGVDWTKRLSDRQSPANLDRGSKALAYHPTAQDELWLASAREGQTSTLWRSTTNGASWDSVGGTSFVNERARTIHIFPTAANEIWVGTAAIEGKSTTGGLWCSTDSGGTWRKVWNNGGNTTVYYGAPNVTSIARNASRNSLFASNSGVWQVTASDWNNTQTYSVRQSAFADQSIPNVTALANGSFWTAEMGDQDWAPKVSPDGVTWTDQPAVLTAAYVPEWSSADHLSKPGARVYGRDMLVQDVNNSARWLLTGGASAHLSEDSGKTWRMQPGGMAGIPTYRADFDRTNPGRAYLSTSDHGVFVVDDGGFSGKTSKSANSTFHELQTMHETMVSADGNIVIGAGVSQELNRTVIVRSENGGTTWSRVTTSGLPENNQGITKAVMSHNDPKDFLVLLGAGDSPSNPGLYRTKDGASFSRVDVGTLSLDGVNTGSRYHPNNAFLERDGVNTNVRYLALRAEGGNTAPRGVWRSLDGGATWEKRTSDVMGNGWEAIAGFAVDPTIEGRLWAIASALRRSDDGGATWVTVGDFNNGFSGGVPVSAYGRRIALIGKRPADTYKKIYYSDDDGGSWRDMGDADHRLSWASNVTVDPWRPGQLWVGGPRSVQLINPPVRVATPTFSPAGGTYTSTQSVTISSATTGATIRYTTNGADPTSSSTVASGAISISATTTLKARAFRLGHPDSTVATVTYTIGSTSLRDPENPTNTVAGVNYDFHQFTSGLSNTDGLTSSNKVSSGTWTGLLTAVPGRDADSDDNNYGLVYTGYINVPTDGTYTFYTNSDDGNKLQIGSTTVASDESPHGARWNDNSVAIGLKAGKHAFTLKFYENAGGDSLKVEYTGPGITRTELPASALYRVGSTTTTVATPTFNPAAGTYTSTQSVTISTTTSGATIRYTTDGSDPTSSSTVANGAISIAATTTLKAKAFLSGSNDSAVASATYTISPSSTLPSGWSNTDINSPGVGGSTTHSSGVYTVKGGGSDIWGTQDQFQYASQSVTGDQTIIARLTSLTSTGTIDQWSKAGVMFRDSTAKGSKYVMVMTTASNGVGLQWRDATDGNTSISQASSVAAPTSTNPVWVKLVKSGTNYKGYYATGTATPTTWTQVGAAAGQTVSFGNATYLAGLAVTAHNNAQLATSTMDNVSIAAPASTGPSATYVSVDTTTLGTWKGVYGASGYSIAQDTQSLPSYVSSLTFANQSTWTWAASSTDTRATQKGGSDRLAACWYSGSNFDITVNITGTAEKQVAIYCLDWDQNGNRSQTIQPFDASTGTSLATAQTVSAFQNGKYVVYNVKGNVRFRVTNTGSPNATVSAVLFGN